MSSEPVFFDPLGTRRRRVSFWAASLGLILAIVTTAFIISLFVVPLLPKFKGLSDTAHRTNRGLIPKLPDVDKRKSYYVAAQKEQELKQEVEREKTRKALSKQMSARKSPAGSPIVAAFYAPFQEVGISSFETNAQNLTHVLPVWLALGRSDPTQLDLTNFGVKAAEGEGKTNSQRLIDVARERGVRIWPVISNSYEGDFDPKPVEELLGSKDKQAIQIASICAWLKAQGFDGLNVDYENLSVNDFTRLPDYLKDLHKALKDKGLGLSIDLEAGNEDLRIKALAKNVDFVVVMSYDEHFEEGDPGPIASVDWTDQVLNKYAAAIPASKLVVGIGSYAYDWTKGVKKADSISYQEALKAALGYRDDEPASKVLKVDQDSLNTTFTYEDDSEIEHQVWMLDGVSAFNTWSIARDLGARGTALWMLGTEDPSIWRFLNRGAIDQPPNPASLKTVDFGPDDVEYRGQGEILYAQGVPVSAHRDVEIDKDTGMVVGATYDGYPSSFYIRRRGYLGPKKVVLTFDDGPDPSNTPAILDVLKRNHVPATFFMIGQQAERSPDLVRRVYDEGHEIGSHTMTHADLGHASDKRIELELNSAQRVIESLIGRSTALFRAPYNADAEPRTPEEIHPIAMASGLGYVSVGEKIDPQDWRLGRNEDGTGPRRTAREVADQVLQELDDPNNVGNVILLHDGGGDRSTTVQALKLLIPELRQRGYEFSTVADMLGTNRDTIMPPITDKDRALIGLDKLVFTGWFTAEWLLRLAFLTAVGLGLARVIMVTPLAMLYERRRAKSIYDPDFRPSVSVVVAAFNEEKVIARTIRSILGSEYHVDEVIVVDDGSQDSTFVEIVTEFSGESRVIALRQENGGKASALNHALAHAKGEIIVSIDADTLLRYDAVGLLVRHFENDRIAAVAGNVKVGNRLNLLTRWQSIEYITSQNLDRRAYALVNGISVCPGALGAWRRASLIEVGAYRSDTLAEDMDLTWRLRRAEWKLETESDAIAYTEAPDTFKGFFSQRFRWAYGTLQCLWKHRRAVGRHGWFGWLSLPTLWLFQIVFQVLAPLVDLQLVFTAIVFFIALLSRDAYTKDWRPAADVGQTLIQLGFMYGLFFTVELVSGLIAYRMDKERARSLWWLFLQRFIYRQIMYVVVYRSLVTALRGRKQGWGKLERKATVHLEKH